MKSYDLNDNYIFCINIFQKVNLDNISLIYLQAVEVYRKKKKKKCFRCKDTTYDKNQNY